MSPESTEAVNLGARGADPGGQISGPPIFVVGTGRSGTTLLASFLDSHSQLSCGPETGVLDRLSPARARRIINDPAWPKVAVRYVMSLKRASGNIVERYGLDEVTVRAVLSARAPSVQAVLEVLTATYAQRRGRSRWVEKTPTHVLHVREIRALWPEAAIVRIVRDPRGVAASHLHVPWGPRTVVGAAFNWQFQDDASWRFLEADPRSMTIRYEDLLANPEAGLRRVCDFIGVAFEPEMLDPGRGTEGGQHAWKTSLVIDAGRADAWQAELSSLDQTRVARLCADGMRRHGYEGALPARATLMVHPYDQSLNAARELLEESADRGIALLPVQLRLNRRLRDPILFYGAARRLRWRQPSDHGGLRTVTRWARLIADARLHRRKVLWVPDAAVRKAEFSRTERACDAVLAFAVRPSGTSSALDQIARRPPSTS